MEERAIGVVVNEECGFFLILGGSLSVMSLGFTIVSYVILKNVK